jgi:hypothetical protein
MFLSCRWQFSFTSFFWKKNMRLTGTPYRPTLITSWQRKPNRSAVVERIQALSKELSAIQAEMHSQLTGPVAGKPGILFEDADAVQALNDLKAELDQLRRILWFYLEEAAKKSPAATDEEQPQSGERAKAAPRALVAQSGDSSSAAEPGWFFDRLNLVIDAYMQGKKPVAAETKALPRRDTKAFS